MLDIYWVAGTGSLPWILVGVAIGYPSVTAEASPEPARQQPELA